MDGGDDQVTLVLAAVIVHDHDDLAVLERAQRFDDFFLVVGHVKSVRFKANERIASSE